MTEMAGRIGGDQERPGGIFGTFVVLSVLFVLFVAVLVVGGRWYLGIWGSKETVLGAPCEVVLARGQGIDSLSKDLERLGLVESGRMFRYWSRFYSEYSRFQAGRYRFEGVVSPVLISQKMIRGETYTPVALQVTVPEGFTLEKIAERLEASNAGKKLEYITLSKDPEFLKELNIRGSSLEGFLYPATYSFTVIPTPREALALMVRTFWEKLPKDYDSKVRERGLTLEQAVTFASLIELETPNKEEMEIISGVIWNRLRRNIPLAIDASLIYGIEDYQGDIRAKDLEDRRNPYNTRIHPGLPPSPIGSPSLEALLAVINPMTHRFFYYVVDANDTTRHRFATTLEEHNANVRAYLKAMRVRRQGNNLSPTLPQAR